MSRQIKLGVNVDHVATIRQGRGTRYPDPVDAALIAERHGAEGITMHLREDRRHIQQRDLELYLRMGHTKLNMEMAATEEMLVIACRLAPRDCCLVPERREELTTEGGLDVAANLGQLKAACARLAEAGISVSLFIDPERAQIDAALEAGAPVVELHTGHYAEAGDERAAADRLHRIQVAAEHAHAAGLVVNAGHGLNYHNVTAVAAIPELNELNIGHAIVARALFDGMGAAVADMRRLMREARSA